jgi:hypothetical protein
MPPKSPRRGLLELAKWQGFSDSRNSNRIDQVGEEQQFAVWPPKKFIRELRWLSYMTLGMIPFVVYLSATTIWRSGAPDFVPWFRVISSLAPVILMVLYLLVRALRRSFQEPTLVINPEGMSMRNGLRGHLRLPWNEIQSVFPVTALGGDSLVIVPRFLEVYRDTNRLSRLSRKINTFLLGGPLVVSARHMDKPLSEVLHRIAIYQAPGEWKVKTWKNAGVFTLLGGIMLGLAWTIGSRWLNLVGMGFVFMAVQAVFNRPKKK